MARTNITLTEILNTPTVNAGIGGWDGAVGGFIEDNISRHRFGLLARAVGVDTGNAFNLIAVPAGHICIPFFFVLFAPDGDPGSLTVNIGPGSNTDHYVDNVSIANLSASTPSLIIPVKLDGGTIFHASAPPGIRPLDGDSAQDRYCKCDFSGTPSNPVDVIAHGIVFPKDDA